MNKTLIGKNGYLFLQNDSCQELNVHHSNLQLCNKDFLHRYDTYKNKYLLIVMPNKSLIYKQYLPDGFDLKYRPAFNLYKEYLQDHILDCYEFLQHEEDTYFKTDTHINLKGNYIVYKKFIQKIKDLFHLRVEDKNINIIKSNCNNLLDCNFGIGDLTWTMNLGDQILEDVTDTYYSTDDFEPLVWRHTLNETSSFQLYKLKNGGLVDETQLNINKLVDWYMVSDYIFYKKNISCSENKIKVLIFYDSLLLSILPLYLNMFYEVYLYKTIYSKEIIDVIQPDYVFEFRVERFLF